MRVLDFTRYGFDRGDSADADSTVLTEVVCILFTLKDRFPLISEGLQGFFPVLRLQQWLVRGPFEIEPYEKFSGMTKVGSVGITHRVPKRAPWLGK